MAGMDTYGAACLDPAEPCAGGMGRLAAELRRLKAGRDNVLVLDAGSFAGVESLLAADSLLGLLADFDLRESVA